MTPQEAIEIITNAVQTENMTAEQDKALAIVQKATDKQTPKKPVDADYDGKIQVGFCPDCEECVSSDFCYNCGQALDWG